MSIIYYFPFLLAKRIELGRINGVTERPIGPLTGKGRIWGSGDFRHWWNLDPHRPSKSRAFVLDTGGRVRSAVTPDDPQAFAASLASAGVAVG